MGFRKDTVPDLKPEPWGNGPALGGRGSASPRPAPGLPDWRGRGASAYVAEHGRRLASLAAALGRRLGLGEGDVATLRLGGLLHDMGKHAIPADLLAKPTPLTEQEFEIVRQHTVIGDAMCAAIPSLAAIRPIVRQHHERLDGSGYPDGVGGADLPLLVQIVGIADVYDALVHARSYKPALDPATACAFLAFEADRGWRDRHLVWEFIELVRWAAGGLHGWIADAYLHHPPGVSRRDLTLSVSSSTS
jgi:putative nucleotidyltransferase with HDIG domain